MLRPLLFSMTLVALATPVAHVRAQADQSLDSEAHALFEAGHTAFAGGRYADALRHFQGAYELSHRAVLLYNIAQCQDRLRHDAEALAAFEQYIAEVPDAPQRAEIEGRLAVLREATSRTSSTTTTTTAETVPTTSASETTTPSSPDSAASAPPSAEVISSPSSSSDPAPWIILTVGGVVAITGAVLVGLAFADIQNVEGSPSGTRFSTVRSSYDQAPILSGIGWAALGVGVALAGVGLVWGLTGSGSGAGEHASLRIGPSGVSITGAF